MIAASKRRGIEITSLSRPIRPSDFRDFDLILAMDRQNKGVCVCLSVYVLFQSFRCNAVVDSNVL